MFDEYWNGYNQVYYIYAQRKLNLFISLVIHSKQGMQVCLVCHIYTPCVKLNLFAPDLP